MYVTDRILVVMDHPNEDSASKPIIHKKQLDNCKQTAEKSHNVLLLAFMALICGFIVALIWFTLKRFRESCLNHNPSAQNCWLKLLWTNGPPPT